MSPSSKTSFLKKHSQKFKLFLMRQFSKLISPEKVVFVFGPSTNTITTLCSEAILNEKMPSFASVMTGEDTTWQAHMASTMLKINKNTEKAVFAVPDDAYLYDPEVFTFIYPQTRSWRNDNRSRNTQRQWICGNCWEHVYDRGNGVVGRNHVHFRYALDHVDDTHFCANRHADFQRQCCARMG
jgi:hypothetical protein